MAVHGVHVEQILVGGGFVTPEEYGAHLAECSGYPFLRPELSMKKGMLDWPTPLADEGTWPLAVNGGKWTIGFVEPKRTLLERVKGLLHKQRRTLVPAMILRSDWRRLMPSTSRRDTITDLTQQLFAFAERNGAFHLRLVGLGGETVVVPDVGHNEPMLRVPSDLLSALRLRLLRQGSSYGWVVQTKRVPGGWWIRLVRHRDRQHPAEWSDRLQRFLTAPKGLLVLVRPDAYLEQHFFHAQPSAQPWRSAAGLQAMRANTHAEQEVALHTALFGHPVVALSDAANPWWEDAVASGLPVTVLRGHETSHGKAWEGFSYAS